MLRTDLEWIQQRNDSGWIVRDPLSENFYFMSQAEYMAIKGLDSQMEPELLACQLHDRYAISNPMEWLRILAIKLQRAHLIKPKLESPAAAPLDKATRHLGWFGGFLINPFSIKIPLFRPPSKLLWAKTLARVFFSKLSVVVCAILWCISILMVFQSWIRDPFAIVQSAQILQSGGWLLLILSFALIKSFHELGHFLACHYFGARCKEVGILFLFFTPCLYCNVTDSWRLPSKWQRCAISLAGIYFELIISILAALCWLNYSIGIEKSIAAAVLVACTFNTIALNGNPLLRYDGYYVLSDLWEVPNLSSQSSMALWDYWIWGLGGRNFRTGDYSSKPFWLAVYGLLAGCYRFSISVTILWLAWILLKPFGLGFLVITALLAMAIGLIYKLKQFLTWMLLECFTAKPIAPGRLIIVLLLLSMLLGLTFFVQIPDLHNHRGFILPRNPQALYAAETSWIARFPKHEVKFRAGQTIIELASPELSLQRLQLQHAIQELRYSLELLRKIAVNDSSTAQEIPVKVSELSELESQASILEQRDKALIITAPEEGVFVAKPLRYPDPIASPIHRFLASNQTYGSRIGDPIERGDVLGWFAPIQQAASIEAYVPEELTHRLRIGSMAACKADCSPDHTFYAQVESISPASTFDLPESLRCDPWLLGLQDSKGAWKPIHPLCRVTLKQQGPNDGKIRGNLVTLHFNPPARSVAHRIMDYFWRNFRWNLFLSIQQRSLPDMIAG